MVRLETAPHCGQSARVTHLLEELGLPYGLVVRSDGHFLATYGRPGPRLVDGDLSLFESGAMMRHLARRTESDLLPEDPAELARCDAWMDFAGFALGLPFVLLLLETRSAETPDGAARIARARERLEGSLGHLEAHLEGREHLLSRFSVADCAMGVLAGVARLVPLGPWPNVAAYLARLEARPARARAIARLERARAAAEAPATPDEVLEFWFGEPAETEEAILAKVPRWFQGGPAMDAEVVERFGRTVEAALGGELDAWAETPRGRLALILVLDRFTRNCFRGDPRTYAGDPKAQRLALGALDRGLHAELAALERLFLGMPLLHAEDLGLQHRHRAWSGELAAGPLAPYPTLAAMHAEQAEKYERVIERFGRFPHRNALLGRESTPEELAFLADWADRAPPSAMRTRGAVAKP